MMNILIIFQVFLSLAYFDSFLDRYPIKKKNKNEAKEAPIPKNILSFINKFFEKFPRKKTVSE